MKHIKLALAFTFAALALAACVEPERTVVIQPDQPPTQHVIVEHDAY